MRYCLKHVAKLVFGIGLVSIPVFAHAACLADGYTIVFVNGVFDSRPQADEDRAKLEDKLGTEFNGEPIIYLLGYNQTHLQGLGDLAEAEFPSLDAYDLDTILMQIAPDVMTRKILIVGHSQGAQYANAIYDYLLADGEPKNAVGVYAVATPASNVAGSGSYRTYSGDLTINSLRGEVGFNPLPANLDFADPFPDNISRWPGHSFSGAYLAAAPDTIVADIKKELTQLVPLNADDSAQTTCFDAPELNLAYRTSAVLLGTGDAVSLGLLNAGEASITAGAVALQAAGTALAAVGDVAHQIASDVGVTVGGVNGLSHAGDPQNRDINFEIISKLYGSSLTKEEYDEYLGNNQNNGGAVVLAEVSDNVPVPPPATKIDASPVPAETPAVPIGPAPGVSPGGSEQTASPTISVTTSDEQVATDTPDIATSSDDDAATTLTAVPFGSPVTDNFDSYDSSGWTAYGLRSIDFDAATDASECHSGGCIRTNKHTDGDSLDEGMRMYKTGTPKDEGSLTIWVRHHVGFEGSDGYVDVCAGTPDVSSLCDGLELQFTTFADQDVWHEYYLAWRDNGSTKEICRLEDDINAADCSWQTSVTLKVGDAPDTVAISGNGVREDLGDRLWFDDLDN